MDPIDDRGDENQTPVFVPP